MPRISRIVSRISAGVGLIALAACSLSDDGTDTLVTAPSRQCGCKRCSLPLLRDAGHRTHSAAERHVV